MHEHVDTPQNHRNIAVFTRSSSRKGIPPRELVSLLFLRRKLHEHVDTPQNRQNTAVFTRSAVSESKVARARRFTSKSTEHSCFSLDHPRDSPSRTRKSAASEKKVLHAHRNNIDYRRQLFHRGHPFFSDRDLFSLENLHFRCF